MEGWAACDDVFARGERYSLSLRLAMVIATKLQVNIIYTQVLEVCEYGQMHRIHYGIYYIYYHSYSEVPLYETA